MANERVRAESFIYCEAVEKYLHPKDVVIDVGGAAGSVHRSKARRVWNQFPTVLLDDCARWESVQNLLIHDVATHRFVVKFGILQGCTHKLSDCVCPPMEVTERGRVFMAIHSAYYLSVLDLDRLAPGDILYIAAHIYRGDCGAIAGEFTWKREAGGPNGRIVMTPNKIDGTRYVHDDITPYLELGFRVGKKSFVGQVAMVFGATVVGRYFVTHHQELHAALPQWKTGQGHVAPVAPPVVAHPVVVPPLAAPAFPQVVAPVPAVAPVVVLDTVGARVDRLVSGVTSVCEGIRGCFIGPLPPRVIPEGAKLEKGKETAMAAGRMMAVVGNDRDSRVVAGQMQLVHNNVLRMCDVDTITGAHLVAAELPKRRQAQAILQRAVNEDWWARVWLDWGFKFTRTWFVRLLLTLVSSIAITYLLRRTKSPLRLLRAVAAMTHEKSRVRVMATVAEGIAALNESSSAACVPDSLMPSPGGPAQFGGH